MAQEHPKTTLSRKHFNVMADQYDTLFVPRLGGYEALHAMILAMLPEPHGRAMRVLELGAGTGNLTRKLLERLPQSQVVGYDLSAGMLAQARSKLAPLASRVHFIEADIGQAVFAGPFDVVVSAIAVYHVPPRAKPALFRRLYEALCLGGVLILGDTFRAATPELDKGLAGNGGRRLRGAPLLLRQDQRSVSAIYLHAGIGRRAETAS